MVRMTYGSMPTHEVLERAFNQAVAGKYDFDLRGTDERTASRVKIRTCGPVSLLQFRAMIEVLIEAFDNGDDAAGDLASSFLYSIGIEWI